MLKNFVGTIDFQFSIFNFLLSIFNLNYPHETVHLHSYPVSFALLSISIYPIPFPGTSGGHPDNQIPLREILRPARESAAGSPFRKLQPGGVCAAGRSFSLFYPSHHRHGRQEFLSTPRCGLSRSASGAVAECQVRADCLWCFHHYSAACPVAPSQKADAVQ